MSSSAGLYVHFAYCARRCNYCDFALATPKTIPTTAYTDALIAELTTRRADLTGPARTLYIGGGTPSLWDPRELSRFVDHITSNPSLIQNAEFTLEANPEDVTPRWLDAILALGVNRISLGVQSLQDPILAALGRVHDAATALNALSLLAAATAQGRLRSFSVDLMYGHFGQDLAAWRAELDLLTARFAPPHLSLYALTVEPKTVLGLAVRRGRTPRPNDTLQGDMLFFARDHLRPLGYTHYEVSSWAQPGHHAVHNSAYWDETPYLGLGAGAHSFLGGRRFVNEGRPSRYVTRSRTEGSAIVATETLTPETARFERLMTGLRRLDRPLLLDPAAARHFATPIGRAQTHAWLTAEPTSDGGLALTLTDLGLRFMDDLLMEFLP